MAVRRSWNHQNNLVGPQPVLSLLLKYLQGQQEWIALIIHSLWAAYPLHIPVLYSVR